tara:strand:- start:1402 stop:1983 length:582 start_codon:yes stop_codon:yes gene_type:complete
MFIPDCGVQGWIHQKDYFEFNHKKGVVGLCEGDNTPLNGSYDYKERQEIKTNILKTGKYIWSADVETNSDELIHAKVFHLFQIHDGRTGGRPPVAIRVTDGNIWIMTSSGDGWYVGRYVGKLHIEAKIKITKDFVIIQFAFDGQPYHKKVRGPIFVDGGGTFIKFGVYRWNAVCDVKQIYRNLRYKKLNVSRY